MRRQQPTWKRVTEETMTKIVKKKMSKILKVNAREYDLEGQFLYDDHKCANYFTNNQSSLPDDMLSG